MGDTSYSTGTAWATDSLRIEMVRSHALPPQLLQYAAAFIAACTRPPRPQPRARASYASPQAVTRPGRHASKQSRDPSSHHTTKQSCDPSSHTTHRRVRVQAVTRPSSHHVTKQSRDPSSHTTLSRGQAHPTHLPSPGGESSACIARAWSTSNLIASGSLVGFEIAWD